MVCGSRREAAAFLRAWLEGQRVDLVADPVDAYGCLLRYVLHRSRNVNAEFVRQGYASAYCTFRYSLCDEFLALQREARLAGRGPP